MFERCSYCRLKLIGSQVNCQDTSAQFQQEIIPLPALSRLQQALALALPNDFLVPFSLYFAPEIYSILYLISKAEWRHLTHSGDSVNTHAHRLSGKPAHVGIFIYFYELNVCMCVCMCNTCVQSTYRGQERVRSPRTGIAGAVNPQCGCWKSNPGPLEL